MLTASGIGLIPITKNSMKELVSPANGHLFGAELELVKVNNGTKANFWTFIYTATATWPNGTLNRDKVRLLPRVTWTNRPSLLAYAILFC